MRALLIFLAATAFPLLQGYADSCTEIQPQLRSVSMRLDHGDTAGAERALAPLEAAHPECAALVLDRARVEAAKDEDGADKTFVNYTSLNPRDAQGWAYFARYLLARGENQRADAGASLAKDCDAKDPLVMAVEGQILDLKGDTQEGIKLLEEAIRLNPEDAEARYQLGSIHDRAKHPRLAVQYFAEEVKINPFDARGWDYLALNLEPLGEINRAQQAYMRGLAENRPGAYFDAFLPYNYGKFLMKLNQLSASKGQLDKAVELTPQVRAVWYERARLNVRLNNLQQARTDAERAAGIEEPQTVIADLQVFVLLDQIYSRLGEPELARKYAYLGRVTPSPVQSEIERTH